MDLFSSKTPRAYTLIRVLFWILAGIFLVAGILLFTLDTHQVVSSKGGEIIAENVPIEYLSPVEGEIAAVFVQEGDYVDAGDTLLILKDEKLSTNYEKHKAKLTASRSNINILNRQLDNLSAMLGHKREEKDYLASELSVKERRAALNVRALEEQLASMKRKLQILEKQDTKDQSLLRKGGISEREYSKKYQAFLDEQKAYADLYNDYLQMQLEQESVPSVNSKKLGKSDMDILSSEREYTDLQKQITEEKIKKENLKSMMAAAQRELDRQVVVARMDGRVSKLYNLKKDHNFITKKKPLLTLIPTGETRFLAKLPISEISIKDIQEGQSANIKLDAYNYYQYGIVKGIIRHIDQETDEKTQKTTFYALADIPTENVEQFKLRGGYKLNGDIILRKVKLYRYVFQKVFNKIEV